MMPHRTPKKLGTQRHCSHRHSHPGCQLGNILLKRNSWDSGRQLQALDRSPHFLGQLTFLSLSFLNDVLSRSVVSLCGPMHCSQPGSSVHGILQARILEWVAVPPPGDLPNLVIKLRSLMSPALAGRFFITSATWTECTGDAAFLPLISDLSMRQPRFDMLQ